MAYDAITIDSNTFIQTGIALEAGLLAQLAQFKDGPVEFVLSEIVTREVRKHLISMTKNGRDKALSALTRLDQLQLVEEADRVRLTEVAASILDSREASRNRLARFLEATGAKNVAAAICSTDDVLKLYFATGAPFEPSGEKKKEFPDAIALLSLQKWAADAGKRILAVSADKGWADFAETSEQIDVEKDLGKALEILQEHAEAAEATVAKLVEAVEGGELPEMAKLLDGMLGLSLARWDFMVDGSGPYHVEAQTRELQFESYNVDKADDAYGITIVRLGNETIVARISATFQATARAEFSMAIWDSVDRDYVDMGSSSVDKEVEFDGSFLITLWGDPGGAPDALTIGDVEIVDAVGSVDFGEIEFDPGDEEDDFDALLRIDPDKGTGKVAGDEAAITDEPIDKF